MSPAQPKPKRTFVQELESKAQPEKPPGKKFTWSSAIVDPAKSKNTDFSSVTAPAPRPQASGTLAPASETLAADRRFIAAVRKAKKVRS